MRLVVDTNVLVSALLGGTSLPAHLIMLWREGRFDSDLVRAAGRADARDALSEDPRRFDYGLQLRVALRVSELLEIPAVVASSDLLGLMPASLGSLMEKRMGLRVLAIPLELPAVPIYLIWHEARRNDSGHQWLREIAATEALRLASR